MTDLQQHAAGWSYGCSPSSSWRALAVTCRSHHTSIFRQDRSRRFARHAQAAPCHVYGEPVPWATHADPLHSAMSFLNFTKYPPSLGFLLLTLGCGRLVLAWIERLDTPFTQAAAVFGGAPLFYYLLHLYALLALQRVEAAALGLPRADVAQVWQVWLIAALLAAALYWPTKRFGLYKRESGRPWVKYL